MTNEALHYKYQDIILCNNNLALVMLDNKYGYIDLSGRIVIPIDYDYATIFFGNFAIVSQNSKYYCIDCTGVQINDFSEKEISELFNNSLFLSEYNTFVDPYLKGFASFDNKMFKGNKLYEYLLNYEKKHISSNKEIINSEEAQLAELLFESFKTTYKYRKSYDVLGRYIYAIQKDGKSALYSLYDSEYITNFKFDDIGVFSDFDNVNIAPIVVQNKLGFVNINGLTVIPPIYDLYKEFNGKLPSLDTYVNFYFQIGIPYLIENGVIVFQNGKCGCYNYDFEQVAPCIFDDIIQYKNKFFVVRSNNKYALVNENMKFIS